MRDSFIFYRSYFAAIGALPVKQQLRLYKAIAESSLNDVDLPLDGVAKGMFALIKPQIEANKTRYENGLKGGKPKAYANQTLTEPEPNPNRAVSKIKANENENPNENENENPNENVNVNENENENALGNAAQSAIVAASPLPARAAAKNSFSSPTLEEITAYCEERKNAVNPKRFLDYFTASNWVDSKGNKVKNWKQKVITWEQNNRTEAVESAEHSYDFDWLDDLSVKFK